MTSSIRLVGTRSDLKKVFSIVSSISEEAAFEFETDRIITKCYTKSRAAYLDMEIKKNYFKDFKVQEQTEIGFKISEMLKIIDICTGEISLSIDERIFLTSKNQIDVEAYIPLISIESGEIYIPKHSYSTSALLRVEYLRDYLSCILGFSRYVEISVNEKIKMKIVTSSGNHITIDVPVEPLSTLDQKDKSTVVDITTMNDIIQYFDNKRNIQLGIDNSLNTVELIYEEDNLYVRSLFCVCD